MKLLDQGQAANMLHVTTATLRRWRSSGAGPAYVRVEGRVRYDTEDITAYLDANRTAPTGKQGE